MGFFVDLLLLETIIGWNIVKKIKQYKTDQPRQKIVQLKEVVISVTCSENYTVEVMQDEASVI